MIQQSKFLNPQVLTHIFGKIPLFKDSELVDIQLRRDGPTLFIRLMTKENIKSKCN
ncbi:Imm50 family immunity protein [Fictibacillus sp. Mic-4]|uniref:Imm50 family immunity protein n=1 Tax=Fictibacillus sp. Mic-4 TaxID=3132826 RepID=UPI003CF78F06